MIQSSLYFTEEWQLLSAQHLPLQAAQVHLTVAVMSSQMFAVCMIHSVSRTVPLSFSEGQSSSSAEGEKYGQNIIKFCLAGGTRILLAFAPLLRVFG